MRPGTLVVLLAAWLLAGPVLGQPAPEPLLLPEAFAEEEPWEGPTLDVEALVEEALRSNPEIRAARAAWEAAAARAPQVAPPEASLSFGMQDVPGFANPRFIDRPTYQLGVSQVLPGRGKIPAKRRLEEVTAAVRREEYREKALRVETELRRLLHELFLVDIRTAVLRKHQQLVEHFIRVAEIQYAVGKGAQPDVIRGQAEYTRLAEELAGLERWRQRTAARINHLLARDPGAPLGRPPHPILPEAQVSPAGTLREAARSYRPRLRGAALRIQQAEAALEAARVEDNPDVKVALTGRFFNGQPDGYMLSASLPLPFLNQEKYRYREIEAEALVEEARAAYETALDEVEFRIEERVLALRQAVEQADIVRRTLLPQARQALRAALSNYQTGRVDFQTLIDAERRVLDAELAYYRHLVEANKARVELEGEVGLRLEELRDPRAPVLPPARESAPQEETP